MSMRALLGVHAPRTLFGDTVIVLFLLSQALDGIFTYLGLQQFGLSAEANPLIVSVIPVLGQGMAVAAAKVFAATLGVVLHLRGVHRAVAVLTLLYVGLAVVPWAVMLA